MVEQSSEGISVSNDALHPCDRADVNGCVENAMGDGWVKLYPASSVCASSRPQALLFQLQVSHGADRT
jgi:hypothetical protein